MAKQPLRNKLSSITYHLLSKYILIYVLSVYKLFAESDIKNKITSSTLRSEGAQEKICKQLV
jgi:hypothetical protein